MKGYLFSCTAFFLTMIFLDQQSCQQQAQASKSKSFFPMAKGNYWVYRDSTIEDGKLISVTNDTDKIVGESNWNGKKTYLFADGKEWFSSGDSVFQLSIQRTQVKFPNPVMMAVEKESDFNYVFGGDAVIRKKISKLSSCPKSKWESAACYEISDDCYGSMIVASGIGILRQRISDCNSGKASYTTKTLVDVHLN